jgi:hypothetical protein
MVDLNSGRFSSVRSKYSVMLLLVFFCVIASFGSPLHDHDLEPSHVDFDCISCHLVHSNLSLKKDPQDLSSVTYETKLVSIATISSIITYQISFFNRGPPVIC